MFVPSSSVEPRLTPHETDDFLKCLADCYRDGAPDRRSEPRYETDTPVTVAVLTPVASAGFRGRVVDVGRRGIGMRLGRKLAVDSRVRVLTEEVAIIGHISWSDETAAGLEFEEIQIRPETA